MFAVSVALGFVALLLICFAAIGDRVGPGWIAERTRGRTAQQVNSLRDGG